MRYLLFFILFFCAQSYGQTLKVKLKQLELPSLAGQIIQSNSSGVPVWRSLSNATGNIVTTDANGQFNYRTPTQTLSDIGAAPSVHTHDASDITSGVLSVNRIPILDYVALTGNQTVSGVKTWNDRQSYKGLRTQDYNISGTNVSNFRKVENVAHYANSDAVVGSIQIKLPITTSTMWSMKVFIFQYHASGIMYPVEMIITGYSTDNLNRSVWCSSPDMISQVRWGRNVANNATYILIDDPDEMWRYPKVEVKEVYYSHNGSQSNNLINASNYSVTISTDETDYVHNGTVTNVDFIKDSRYALASSLTGYLPLSAGVIKSNSPQTDPNLVLTQSMYRFNPNPNNPTNHHYAIITYGNGSNVTGQLATHYSNGNTYVRSYNNAWSPWKRLWSDADFTLTDISNGNTAYLWGNHASAGYLTSATAASTYAPISHNHTIADVTGLQTALDGYEEATNKAQDFTTVNQTLYPSTQAVVDYIDDEKGVAQWNANKLQGTDLLLGTPSNGDVVIYDGGWKNMAPPWLTSNQTIVLSGDVTGSGATSISTTIANNAVTTAKIANSNVTLAKIQNIGTQRILGRSTSGSGVIEELQLSDGLFLSSGYLYSLWYNEPSVTGTKIRPSASSFPDGNIEVVSTLGFGRAYNYNLNSDCYEITEKDERYINTTNSLVNLKFNIDNLNNGQTIKISNRNQDGVIRFTNILCEPGDVIVDYFDDKGDPIYLNRIGSGEKYDWVEIQRVKISSQDYLLVVEAGKTF